MDFLNLNSVETLPGYEARAAFTVNSSSVFKEDVDIVPTIVDDSLSYIPWAATIKCRSTCSRSSRNTKLWQTANVSTPRSATDPACNTASLKPPLPSNRKSRTFCLTMTSPLTFSASVRILSTSALPCPCLFSTRTAQRLCAIRAKYIARGIDPDAPDFVPDSLEE